MKKFTDLTYAETLRKHGRGRRMWLVVDSRGITVGQCETRKAADAFVRDSLNTTGWRVIQVRV